MKHTYLNTDLMYQLSYAVVRTRFRALFPKIAEALVQLQTAVTPHDQKQFLKTLVSLMYGLGRLGLLKEMKALVQHLEGCIKDIQLLDVEDCQLLIYILIKLDRNLFGALLQQIKSHLVQFISRHLKSMYMDDVINCLGLLLIDFSHQHPLFKDLISRLDELLSVQNTMSALQDKFTFIRLHDLQLYAGVFGIQLPENVMHLLSGSQIEERVINQRHQEINPIKDGFLKLVKSNLKENAEQDKILGEKRFNHLPEYLHPDYIIHNIVEGQQQDQVIYIIGTNSSAGAEDPAPDAVAAMRFQLLEKLLNIRCKVLSIYQIVGLEGTEIVLRPELELQSILQGYFQPKYSSATTRQMMKQMEQYIIGLQAIVQLNGDSALKDIRLTPQNVLLLMKLIEHLDLYHSQLQVALSNMQMRTFVIGSAEFLKLRLFQISQLYQQMDESTQNAVNGLLKSVMADHESLPEFLDIQKKSLLDIAGSTPVTEISHLLADNKWIGKRLSIDLLKGPGAGQKAAQIHPDYKDLNYVNQYAYLDSNYHTYDLWQRALSEKLPVDTLSFTKKENPQILQLLDQNGCNTIIPDKEKVVRRQIRPMSYSYNWENIYLPRNDQERPISLYDIDAYMREYGTKKAAPLDRSEEFIVQLLNFKYELKTCFSISEIADMLTKFDFIEDLIDSHLAPGAASEASGQPSSASEPGKQLPRNYSDYSAYLHNLHSCLLFTQKPVQHLIAYFERNWKIINLWNIK